MEADMKNPYGWDFFGFAYEIHMKRDMKSI